MMWIVMSKEKKIAIDWVEENKEQVIDGRKRASR
jgi:hypothetical protein